jgi:two-component system phosphate regulon sensor histidine kinase PhoR
VNRTLKNTALVISVIILLPLITFSVYQLNSLSDNEKVLEGIYTEQLNTIIFSVNQYVDDIVQDWTREVKNIWGRRNLVNAENPLEKFLSENESISMVIVSDTSGNIGSNFYTSGGSVESITAEKRMGAILNDNKENIASLINVRKVGYNRIQPLTNKIDNTPLLSFFLEELSESINLGILVLNLDSFMNGIVAKKIASVSREEFIVSIFKGDSLITSTVNLNSASGNIEQSKPFWLLPEYRIVISSSGNTITDLVRERTLITTIIIVVLNILIIGGVVFVFWNVRKEVKLTQLKSDFVSNVSHELRTPLALISMFAETLELKRVTDEDKKEEYYKTIRIEAERLTNIVNKILNFSQLESEKKKFSFADADLNAVVNEVIETYRYHLEKHNTVYRLSSGRSPIIVNIDSDSVKEAIINLIDNAIKYSRENKEIEINLGADSDTAWLAVTDNGVGISKEDQKKIFEKFYRVSSGLVHDTKGSGLGLSLVKYIMDAHDGSVKVNSKPGKGSTFKLIFPYNKKEKAK